MPEKTLEQIDAELEKEYFGDNPEKVKEEDEKIITDEDLEVEVIEKEVDEKELEENNSQEQVQKPETKQDKQEYAWKKMREEQQALQKQLKEKQDFLFKVERMAKGLGYTSSEELIKRFDEEESEKEAQEKGVDPEFYKEFKKMQEELQLTKQEKESQFRQSRILEFTNSLDALIKENGLPETDKQKIIGELEADGYTMDDIVNIKSPRKLLAGYMVDKIAEKKIQDKLKEKKSFVDEKHDSSVDISNEDLEKQIQDEIKQYARSQGYKI
jgi:hypothetical protein